ncbi:MAG: winged helix-turn-helix transcriptional regulator [Cuniculiplasma sp.]
MKTTTQIAGEICPVVQTIKVIGGKWELIIIRYLADSPMRFNELLRNADGISSRTLSRILKTLMERGLVKRELVSIQPVKVIYSLTESGNEIKPVIEALRKWGEKNIKTLNPNTY